MTKNANDYFKLSEHNIVQRVIFTILVIAGVILTFSIIMPALELGAENYLQGRVVNDGSQMPYSYENVKVIKTTDYFFNWAVDVYMNTSQEARYWLNPVFALSIPILLIGLALAFIFTSFLPQNIGYIRQKIERELAGRLDALALFKYMSHDDEQRKKIREELKNADLRDLHDLEKETGVLLEDLIVINKAINWSDKSIFGRIINIFDGIKLYMRFSFTAKYSNVVLSLIYAGAAVLIIIIGLRGLKLIPATEPSPVLFSLGLEFCLLILYSLNLMFERGEEDVFVKNRDDSSIDILGGNIDPADAKEIEMMLKMFVKSKE